MRRHGEVGGGSSGDAPTGDPDTQQALRRSERRFRAAVEAVDGVVWTNDAHGRMSGEQPGWEWLTGQSREEYRDFGWTDRVHPDDVQATLHSWMRAVETKRFFAVEHRLKRRDGSWGLYAVRAVPVVGEDGAVEEWVGIHRDVTAQKEAEAALRRQRDRAQHYLQIAGVMLLVLDRHGRVETINQRGAEILGVGSPEALIGKDWFDTAIPPSEREGVRAAFDGLMNAHLPMTGIYENAVLRADGKQRLISWRNTVLFDDHGRPSGTLSSGEDVTEQRAAAAKERLLSEEIDHRAKNVLSVVQAILQLTRADEIDRFREVVSGRIEALARTHDLLAAARWTGVDLWRLASEELSALGVAPARTAIEGPPLLLMPAAAQTLSIVLHELALNALRHGALSEPGGEISLRWDVPEAGKGMFGLTWRESGGPATAAPSRSGFGSAVLKASVEQQLRGSLEFDWQSDGLRCRIEAPMSRLVEVDAGRSRRSLTILVAEPAMAEDGLADKIESAGFAVHAGGADLVGAAALLGDGAPAAAVISARLGQDTASRLAVLLRDSGVPFVYCGEEAAMKALPQGAVSSLDLPCDGRILAAVVEVAARGRAGV